MKICNIKNTLIRRALVALVILSIPLLLVWGFLTSAFKDGVPEAWGDLCRCFSSDALEDLKALIVASWQGRDRLYF